jgi:hypothetical protein
MAFAPFRRSLLAVVLLALSCSRAPAPQADAPQDPALAPNVEIPSVESIEAAPPDLVELRPTTATAPLPADALARIRDEGLNRSQAMATLSHLTDVIGPRLTGSPNLRRANEWTRKTLTGYGLANAADEPWGPFGRGWSLKRFSAQIVEPQTIPLIAAPKAWSPGFDKPITADVVYVEAKTDADLQKYRGKVKGAIVLAFAPRDLQPRYEPLATRVSDSDLLKLANAAGGSQNPLGLARSQTASERRAMLNPALQVHRPDAPATTQSTTLPAGGASAPGELLRPADPSAQAARPATTRAATTRPAATQPAPNVTKFLLEEGAAVMVNPSGQGDGGTLFTASAALPTAPTTRATTNPTGPRVWSPDAPKTIPQVTLATEDYNRLIRMIRAGEKLRMQLDLQVQFHDDDRMAYNTVAEIPGTDLKHEIVMLGAHLDSWHSGTGATDNAVGVAACMEAVRILKAAGLRPRRTIRIALWTGEEQGLYGSKAYVEKHFGKFEEPTPTTRPGTRPAVATTATVALSDSRQPAATAPTTRPSSTRPASRPARRFVPGPEFDRLSAYFNLDNGAGKIRGVYLQGNEAARPIFRQWLTPLGDLGADTLTLSNTGGTDHVPFDAIGLPAFQFIQDPLEYWTRTHHSNQDTYDRVPADDLKQAATVMATFVYNAAVTEQKIPRKAVR